MIEVCDPDADLDILRKLIKMNTGHSIKLTKEQTCQVYDDIKAGKLPLPPLIMSSNKTYLVDKKSPLTVGDYEILFDSSSKRVDIKRVARKVGLKQLDQMTKSQMIDSIGKRLRFMKIHEPVKIGRKYVPPVKKDQFNNTAVVNNNANTAVNRFNNTVVTNNNANTAVRTNNVNRFNNTAVRTNNVNRFNNTAVRTNNVNRFNNTAVRTNNVNRFNNTVVVANNTRTTRVNFPKGGLFVRGQKPKFLNGQVSAVKKPKTSFLESLFGPKRNFIPSSTFKGTKKGYAFKIGNQGTGYYVNAGGTVFEGPEAKVPNAPNVPKAPIVETNIKLNIATNRIRKIGLKREKPFVNKLGVGGVNRQSVIDEAIKYRELESEFLSKIGKMSLSNVNRQTFINRMVSDSLEQLEAEAQLKSDEMNNIVRTNEQKMNIILATLPFINNSSKLSFKSRSKAEGVNIQTLIEEAKKNNETKRTDYITSQKQKFMTMIINVKLSDEDKKSLQNSIDNETNLNSLKNRATQLFEQRKKEKESLIKQNLLTFLTPLNINQTNKNKFLTRFNKGESINVLKREAKVKESEVARGGAENMRIRLVKRLDELNINAQNKNSIMSRFNNGNKNINKLVTEAKNLKITRNVGKIGTEKERLTTLAKQLNVYNNFSNSISKLRLMPAAENLEKRIITAGTAKTGGVFAQKIKALSNIAREMNLDADIKATIFKIETNADVNATKVRMIDGGKKKLYEKAKSLNINYSPNIEKLQNVEKMVQLRNAINTAGANKKAAEKTSKLELLTERRREVKNYINQNKTLPQNKKNAFIKQVNVNSTNLNVLRKEINTEIQRVKNTKRSKNLDELEQYLEPLNINKSTFIQQFKNSNVSLSNIKASINKEVAKRGDINSKKRVVIDKIKEAREYGVVFNFNTTMTNNKIEEVGRKVDTVINGVINKTRNTLSNKIINAGVKNDYMNKITAIKTLKNMKTVEKQIENAIQSTKNSKKSEITKYMKGLGLTNENIQSVIRQNASLNESRTMANTIIQKKKRLELTEFLDERKVPVVERNQFYNQISKGNSINRIKRDADKYMKEISTQKENISQVLKQYNLKNEDRKFILQEWEYYTTMTPENVTNLASKLQGNFKKEKELSLRKYITDELKLKPEDIETIMKNFNLNPRNMNTLREKAKKTGGLSGEKNRLSERIRKAREENKLNLNFNVNVKNMNNVKNLNSKINNAYIGRNKKNIARRALNRNINISSNLNAIKSMNNVQRLKNKLNGILIGKKKEDLRKLVNVMDDLNQENRERFLKRFKNQNNSLGTLLENVKKLKNNISDTKIKVQKQELYTYLDETLNLNVSDRNAIMLEFNTVKNVNTMKRKANSIKKQRNGENVAENRKKLEEILKSINLDEQDKKSILSKFNRAPGNVNGFEANAKKLVEQKKVEKRTKEISELNSHMGRLNLSEENKQKIRNLFTQNPDKTLNSAKMNASTIRQTRNQEKLENTLKNLTNLSKNNKTEFRTKLKQPNANLGVIIRNAQVRNVSMKKKKAGERNIADYVSSLNIGETGNKLVENFKKGLLTANKVREEANQKRASLNANTVVGKKKNLRTFMNKTLLTNANKNTFINRVTLKENVGVLEKEITTLNTQLKNVKNAFATKQTELRTSLNGLTNLTNEQKTKFMSEVKNANTNIEPIKKRAQNINEAKKTGKQTTINRAVNKTENNFNAGKALNILNKQRAGEAKRKERAVVKNTENTIYTLETLNTMKDARELQNYVRSTSLPENMKKKYIAQLNRPGTNLKAIRGIINANTRKDVESKLKKIKGLTNADVTEFIETRNLNKAQKRGAGRIKGKSITKERAKPEKTNNFNAATAFNNLNLGPKRNALIKKTKNIVTNPFGRIGKWKPAIMSAKTMKELNTLDMNLDNRVKLRNEIKKSALTPREQREYTDMVMKLNKNVKNTRNLFEKGISNVTGPLVKGILNKVVANNKPVYENSNSNNNNNKPNMKPNPTFEPAMQNNPTFEKLTNENKKPLISAINTLKKLPQNRKRVFKGQLDVAFKNQNLNKMKEIRNKAVMENREISEKEKAKKAKKLEPIPPNAPKPNKPSFRALVQKNKEKRVMNAVKTATQKTAISQATGTERIKLARKFAPSTQVNVKKANNAGKLLIRKAAEGARNAAKDKLKRNAEKRATMMNKSSYQAKINSRNFNIPKNRKKIYTGRIQRATTVGQVLKAYENAQNELPK